MFSMALAHWVPEMFAVFRKKYSLPSFLHCSSISSRCSFVISFAFALAWFLISALSLWYFSTFCSALWNSGGEISLSYIEMILDMLSGLVWASSLMELCFFFALNFRLMAIARERSRLVPLKAIPTSNPTPKANAAISDNRQYN